ncbi:hypothetical protein P0E93_003368 [Vibrio metschnikovii]|nr:hypothetical protein [Vibrio metschnikovii]
MSDRINLTLTSGLWARIDEYRGTLFMTRQEFVKYAVSEHVQALDRIRERHSQERARLVSENDALRSQLDNLKRDFQTATGKPAKIR